MKITCHTGRAVLDGFKTMKMVLFYLILLIDYVKVKGQHVIHNNRCVMDLLRVSLPQKWLKTQLHFLAGAFDLVQTGG